MPSSTRVAYVASHNAVLNVLDCGFVALAPGMEDEPVVFREVDRDVLDGVDDRGVVLVEMPAELLSYFERSAATGGPGRTFAVPGSIADRFPILAFRAGGPPAPPRPSTAADPAKAKAKPARPRPRMPRLRLAGPLRRPRVRTVTGLAVLALAGAGVTLYLLTSDDGRDAPQQPSAAASAPNPEQAARAEGRPGRATAPAREERRLARRSRAVGSTTDGSLLNGVPVPADGADFFTWDIPRGASPNPRFRRFATFTVVQRVRGVIADYRRANPRAPRVGIADLSLPKGGEFGVNFGGTGHLGHRNGTEVDILYPRRDRAEQATGSPAEADRRLAQDLVDRFLEVGAIGVVVDADVGLTGPVGRIETAPFHEDHMHIRFPARE